MSHAIDKKLAQIDKRIAKLSSAREELLRQKAAESGWEPCMDCFNGFCCMNCSSAPIYMQVLV